MTYSINNFRNIAETDMQNILEESVVWERDVTELFYKEIKIQLKRRELIIIQVNGKVRLGKSTVGWCIAKTILKEMYKLKLTTQKEFTLNNVAMDQQEYNQFMMNPDTNFTVILTDEDNNMEKTGENSTTIASMDRDFSNIHAVRYVNQVNCSPNSIKDPNTDLILEVVSQEKVTRETVCKLYYRYFPMNIETKIPIGIVKIYVGDIIKNWEDEVKKHFLKPIRTKKDNEIIQKWAKKDSFVKYNILKEEKLNLITKYHIFKPRELEASKVINIIIKRNKHLVKYKKLTSRNRIKIEVENISQKEGNILSILGRELATDRVDGILELYRAKINIDWEIDNFNKKCANGKIDKDKFIQDKKNLLIALADIEERIIEQETKFEEYEILWNKYRKELRK